MTDKEINPNLLTDTRIYKELYKLGLSKKEAAVYVASLQLGTSTIQNIATVAAVNRATTYVLIEALVKRGLMHSVTYGKKRFFTAEEPDKLDFFIHEDKVKLEKKEALIKSIIPELEKIFDINKLENKTKPPELRSFSFSEYLETKYLSAIFTTPHKNGATKAMKNHVINEL